MGGEAHTASDAHTLSRPGAIVLVLAVTPFRLAGQLGLPARVGRSSLRRSAAAATASPASSSAKISRSACKPGQEQSSV